MRTSPVHAAMAELTKVAHTGNGFALPAGGGDIALYAAATRFRGLAYSLVEFLRRATR